MLRSHYQENLRTVAPVEPCIPGTPCGPVLPMGPGGPGGPVIVAREIAWQDDTSKSDSEMKKQLQTASADELLQNFAQLATRYHKVNDTLEAEHPEQRQHILSHFAPHKNWLDRCRMLRFATVRRHLRRL